MNPTAGGGNDQSERSQPADPLRDNAAQRNDNAGGKITKLPDYQITNP
jgi:hypothetical protein